MPRISQRLPHPPPEPTMPYGPVHGPKEPAIQGPPKPMLHPPMDLSQPQPQGPIIQPELFNSAALERQNRVALGQERLRGGTKKQQEVRDTSLAMSTIPTSHLQSRPGLRGEDIAVEGGTVGRKKETKLVRGQGHYQPEKRLAESWKVRKPDPETGKRPPMTFTIDADEVAFGTTPRMEFSSTLIHELGHRHQHSDNEFFESPRVAGLAHEGGTGRADPLHEAHADAYVDRYFKGSKDALREPGGEPAYKEMEKKGYSTNFFGDASRGKWDAADRALYAAARAHLGDTGEVLPYQEGKRPSAEETRRDQILTGRTKSGASKWSAADTRPNTAIDATIHHLLLHSDAAEAGVAATTWTKGKGTKTEKTISMQDEADKAFRRHQDRQLLRQGQFIQEDLFGDPNMSYNQFGELPRTVKQVEKTLKIKKASMGSGSVLESNRRGLL